MMRLSKDLALPLVLLALLAIWPIANFKFGGGVWMPHGVALLGLRVLLVAIAGYLATYRAPRSLWTAATVGAAMFFVEQVIVVGTFFVLDSQPRSAVNAVESFALLVWVPCLIGTLGGWLGRRARQRRFATTEQ